MEEIELTSWLSLDALKKEAKVAETVGDLQTGHCMAVFCQIEDDYLELCYSDTASNYLRRYEDKEEFDLALENRKEEFGEKSFNNEEDMEDAFETEDTDNF